MPGDAYYQRALDLMRETRRAGIMGDPYPQDISEFAKSTMKAATLAYKWYSDGAALAREHGIEKALALCGETQSCAD